MQVSICQDALLPWRHMSSAPLQLLLACSSTSTLPVAAAEPVSSSLCSWCARGQGATRFESRGLKARMGRG